MTAPREASRWLAVGALTALAQACGPSPPAAAPAPQPAASDGPQPPGSGWAPMQRGDSEASEAMVGAIRLVDVPGTVRSLENELETQRQKALAHRERMVLYLVSKSCAPCTRISGVLSDPKMQAALAQVRLVRVEANASPQALRMLGIPTRSLPGFFLLGDDLRPTDGIDGGEWGEDTADNAAPVLGAFVRGTYGRRRKAFSPGSLEPIPGGR